MRTIRDLGMLAAVTLLAVWPAAAQFNTRLPDFRGVFNPVVGQGAAYEQQNKNSKNQMEMAIVGKEDVNGKTGYWMEMSITQSNGMPMYLKYLMAVDGQTATFARIIMQTPGQPPMDMTALMSRGQTPPQIDSTKQATPVGSESVTMPAGTFDCMHYKAKDGSWEAWISPKVGPWGLVKSTSGDTTMVLSRVITNATDHITGTPQQFNIPDFARQQQGQPGAR